MMFRLPDFFVNSAGFFYDSRGANPSDLIAGHFDPALVLLSYFIAAISSMVALFISSRLSGREEVSDRRLLLIVAGLAMGGGIFSMHFVGMMAFKLPLQVTYEPVTTLLSLVFAVGGSLLAFALVGRYKGGWKAILLGGLAIGIAISGMHYTGMSAMRMNATLQYRAGPFAFSLLVGFAAATAALWFVTSFKKEGAGVSPGLLAGASAVMGLAVYGLHYTAMAAAVYVKASPGAAAPVTGLDDDSFTLFVIFITGLVLSLAIIFPLKLEIEERKKSENDLRLLATMVAQTPQAMLITNVKGIITYANPALEKLTGYKTEEVLGRSPGIFKGGRHDKKFYDNFWATILSGRNWDGIFINKRKDGRIYEERIIVSPVLNDASEIISFIAIKTDITDENMLRRTKDRVTTVVSHELHTPIGKLQLAGILADEILRGGKKEDGIRQLKDLIARSVADFSRIADDATLFSSLSLHPTPKAFAGVYLHDLADACVASTRSMMSRERRAVVLDSDISSLPIGFKIGGNAEMMGQVLTKILSNAIKYTPDGKTVWFKASLADKKAEFVVRDEGVGIPAESLASVFEPYHSMDDPMKHSTSQYASHGGGLGLGLSIARLIMDYHGGSITVVSDGAGTGATVTLVFPTDPSRGA